MFVQLPGRLTFQLQKKKVTESVNLGDCGADSALPLLREQSVSDALIIVNKGA